MLRRNKKLLFLIAISVISASLWLVDWYLSPITFEKGTVYIQSGTRMWPFDIEIAKTDRQREQGLMHRRRLGKNDGMLFEFPKPQPVSMWMKDTLIPLDMLFIDENGKILYIAHKLRPRSLTPIKHDAPVAAVLELAGNATKIRMIGVGDTVIHPFFDPPMRKR